MKNLLVLSLMALIATSCNQQHPDYTKNLETAQKLFQLHEIEDYDAQYELMSENLVSESSLYGSGPMNKDQFMANVKGYHMAFDNLKYTPEVWLPGTDTLGQLDGSVRTYGVWTGTQVQTQKEVSLKGYWYFNFDKDGKIVGQGDYFDFGGMLDAVYPKNLVFAAVQAKAGQLDNLLEVLNGENGLPKTRSFEGCMSLDMTVNKETNTVWIVSNWGTNDQYLAYLNWRQTEDNIIQTMVPLLEGGTEGLKIAHSNSGFKSF
jgi:hypothetical protein